MARGLKIANKQTDGTITDQRITSIQYQGAVGGIPQWVTSTGVKTIKVQYRTAANVFIANAYIISQRGSTQFMVANAVGAVNGATHSNASVSTCTLVNIADPANVATTGGSQLTAPNTMAITGYNTANAAVAVKRITNKFMTDFGGTKSRYRHSSQVATATFGNVVTH